LAEGAKCKLRGETILSFLAEEGMEMIDSTASQTRSFRTCGETDFSRTLCEHF